MPQTPCPSPYALLAHGLHSPAALPPLLHFIRTLLLQPPPSHPTLLLQTLSIIDDLLLGLASIDESSDGHLLDEAVLPPLLTHVLSGRHTRDEACDAKATAVLRRLCETVGLPRLLPLLCRCVAPELGENSSSTTPPTTLEWPARAAIAKVHM